GFLFDALAERNIALAQLSNINIVVLKNLQHIVSEIKGSILYRIGGLNLLGEPTDQATIEIMQKTGVLEPIPSRVETDHRLKGTKRIIVGKGNVYVGKGRKDGRSILVIPAFSSSSESTSLIEYLLLLNIGFKQDVPLAAKTKALGGKYENLKNIVLENSVNWDDGFLEMVPMDELFGRSAEKIGEAIVSKQQFT
ncbi:MAG: glutamine--fructose-6-phosphate aminotransferase, partial [Deltaproteobacteria bacterium]|nr:glutamine--fructose-6-phosphate aminotransferase [Deltaproteobacteria bacterium]